MGGPAHQAALLSGRRFFPDRYETLLVHGRLAAGEESAAYLSEREGARMLYLPDLVQPCSPGSPPLPPPHRPHPHREGGLRRSPGSVAGLLAAGHRPKIVHTFHGHVLEGYFGGGRRRHDFVTEATVSDLPLGVAVTRGLLLSPRTRSTGVWSARWRGAATG